MNTFVLMKDTLILFPYDPNDHDDFVRVRTELTGSKSVDTVRFGGSDIGTILGVNQWGYKGKLFHELIGNWTREQKESAPIFFGHENEPKIRSLYEFWEFDVEGLMANRKAGKKVRSVNEIHAAIVNPELDFMFCNPDGIIVENGEEGVFEAKNIERQHMKQYKDGIVRSHYLQTVFNMMVCDVQFGALAYFINGNDYQAYPIARDAELEAIMLDAINDFALRILKGKMIMQTVSDPIERSRLLADIEPEPEDSDACKKFFDERYLEKIEGGAADGTLECREWLDNMLHWSAAEQRAKKLKTLNQNRIKKEFGTLGVNRLNFDDAHITLGRNKALYPTIK
jgi:predicted phage-related endonuclease